MGDLFKDFYDLIMNTIDALGVYGPLFGSLLIVIESIIPVLPLFVFITLNYLAFGHFLGFIISWVCTILGCILAYFLVKKLKTLLPIATNILKALCLLTFHG